MRYYITTFFFLVLCLALLPIAAGRAAVTGTEFFLPPEAKQQSQTQGINKEEETKKQANKNTQMQQAVQVQAQEAVELPLPSPLPMLPTVKEPMDSGFCVLDETTGQLHQISVQDYVRGAVCAEMPPSFHTEALKAQAISAHSYALNRKKQQAAFPDPKLKGADFSADPSHWRGYVTEEQARERFGAQFSEYWGKICAATDAVFHEILVYDKEPIAAAYHAISCGTTESAQNVWGNPVPYLQPVQSSGDLLAPGYEKQRAFSQKEMRTALLQAFPNALLGQAGEEWITVTEHTASGYVSSASVGGQAVTGISLRQALGLRSANFTVEQQGGNFIVTTYGYGHGVGLSQYGADYMARQGKTYREILSHYYKGAQLMQCRDNLF